MSNSKAIKPLILAALVKELNHVRSQRDELAKALEECIVERCPVCHCMTYLEEPHAANCIVQSAMTTIALIDIR